MAEFTPMMQQYLQTKEELHDRLVSLLGGRAAEELIFGNVTTGAANDIEQATNIATNMITRFGMSDNLGTVFYDSESEEVFIGRDFGTVKAYSEEIAAQIDNEVRSIIDTAYDRCEDLLKTNIAKLHVVAQALLEREKIDGAEFEELFNSIA